MKRKRSVRKDGGRGWVKKGGLNPYYRSEVFGQLPRLDETLCWNMAVEVSRKQYMLFVIRSKHATRMISAGSSFVD
jgi:hypothetical protein